MEGKWREGGGVEIIVLEQSIMRTKCIDSLNPCNHNGSLNYTISAYHFYMVLPLSLLCIGLHWDLC